MLFFPALVTGRLYDMGYFKRTLLFFRFVVSLVSAWEVSERSETPSVFLVVVTVLIAECKAYWQLLLCQGFASGISCGMIFGPVFAVIGHWFKRRRALAFGITSFGAAMGGVLFPIAARKLFEDVGCVVPSWPWVSYNDQLSQLPLDNAYSCLDFTGHPWHYQPRKRLLNLFISCNLLLDNQTMKRRLPVPTDLGPFFALYDLKKPGFVLYCIAPVITSLGLYTSA